MSNQGHTMTLHTYNTNQCPYEVSTSYTLETPLVKTVPQQPLRTVGLEKHIHSLLVGWT